MPKKKFGHEPAPPRKKSIREKALERLSKAPPSKGETAHTRSRRKAAQKAYDKPYQGGMSRLQGEAYKRWLRNQALQGGIPKEGIPSKKKANKKTPKKVVAHRRRRSGIIEVGEV